MSHYSQLHYTVIWCNALFWTQLNHAVHYVTAPLHCIALVCITLCKHEHCTVHWQCSPVTLNYALCNFTVHFTITALDALCYCTVHCDIALRQFSALCHCTAPATLGARLSFSGVRVSARQSSFLATICPENDQIHGSGQRKQNKQSEAKIGHMTIDLHEGGPPIAQGSPANAIFYNS